jgi:hypothetical protein
LPIIELPFYLFILSFSLAVPKKEEGEYYRSYTNCAGNNATAHKVIGSLAAPLSLFVLHIIIENLREEEEKNINKYCRYTRSRSSRPLSTGIVSKF